MTSRPTEVWVTTLQEEGCNRITLRVGAEAKAFLVNPERVSFIRFEAEGLRLRDCDRRSFELGNGFRPEIHPVAVIDRWVRSADNLGIGITREVLDTFESILNQYVKGDSPHGKVESENPRNRPGTDSVADQKRLTGPKSIVGYGGTDGSHGGTEETETEQSGNGRRNGDEVTEEISGATGRKKGADAKGRRGSARGDREAPSRRRKVGK